MSHNERVFEMMKSIAPEFVKKGVELQKRLVAAGSNPEKCTVGGKSIPDAYAESAAIWAEAFVKEIERIHQF